MQRSLLRRRSQIRNSGPRVPSGDKAKIFEALTGEHSCKDEARIGQKNKITRRWAKRGARPSAPHDQRTASTYIFGAICPKEGKGAALVLPTCNTEAMSLHLAEIANEIAPGKHAVLLLDQLLDLALFVFAQQPGLNRHVVSQPQMERGPLAREPRPSNVSLTRA